MVGRANNILGQVSARGSRGASCGLYWTAQPRLRGCGGLDNAVFGQLAAQHFRQRGYRHFGIVEPETNTLLGRRDGFVREVRQYGMEPEVFRCGGLDEHGLDQMLVSTLRRHRSPLGFFTY